MSKLVIKDLHVSIDGKEILKGLNLEVNKGEVHALMGPNGNGKSTLLAAIMGNPRFEVTSGSITLDGEEVLEMEVDERSRAGLFLGMQYPLEVPGVVNSDFLKAAVNARREKPIPLFEFIKKMENNIKTLHMKSDLAHRFLNDGFSGGEKKRNEILQMLMLDPSIIMLDEIDSGLDVDAIKVVANAVNKRIEEQESGFIIVSHYERFLQLVKPTHTHIVLDGKVVLSGGIELVNKIDTEGYDWIVEEYGATIATVEKPKVSVLGTCGVNSK